MSNRENETSRSERTWCDPWNGSRSPGFLKFKRDFRAAAMGYYLHEDDYSIWEACMDMDQGGQGNNAPAMLAQGQNGSVWYGKGV